MERRHLDVHEFHRRDDDRGSMARGYDLLTLG